MSKTPEIRAIISDIETGLMRLQRTVRPQDREMVNAVVFTLDRAKEIILAQAKA